MRQGVRAFATAPEFIVLGLWASLFTRGCVTGRAVAAAPSGAVTVPTSSGAPSAPSMLSASISSSAPSAPGGSGALSTPSGVAIQAGAGLHFTCDGRLEQVRAELLAAGFAPARNTAQWLQVSGTLDGGVVLRVYTVYTPDGDGYRVYEAEIRPYRGKAYAWHLREQILLDEMYHEERLPERTWTSARNGFSAKLHTRTDEHPLVDQFEAAARPALDDCLNHHGAQSKLERCELSRNGEQVCKTF